MVISGTTSSRTNLEDDRLYDGNLKDGDHEDARGRRHIGGVTS